MRLLSSLTMHRHDFVFSHSLFIWFPFSYDSAAYRLYVAGMPLECRWSVARVAMIKQNKRTIYNHFSHSSKIAPFSSAHSLWHFNHIPAASYWHETNKNSWHDKQEEKEWKKIQIRVAAWWQPCAIFYIVLLAIEIWNSGEWKINKTRNMKQQNVNKTNWYSKSCKSFAELFVCCGFFLIYFLEELALKAFVSSGHFHGKVLHNKRFCVQIILICTKVKINLSKKEVLVTRKSINVELRGHQTEMEHITTKTSQQMAEDVPL